MELLTAARRCDRLPVKRQRGVVLFVTLVVLVLMTLATVAVVRSMDTANVIAGNFAFKQAGMQASDRAITDAMNMLANIVQDGGGSTDLANRYFHLRQTSLDALGVPTTINWSNVACVDERGVAVTACDTDLGMYRIQYYIERQCDADPDVTNIQSIKTHCDYEVRQSSPSEQIAVRYRVIVRVRGPRNATGMYEVMVSGPATT